MRFKTCSLLVIFVIISIGLSNCGIGQVVVPPATPVRTKTLTPTSAPISTPTLTQMPIPVILPTLLPPTLEATYSSEELSKQFDTILGITNAIDNDCTLPCFWDITPGETRWSEVLHKIDQTGLRYSEYESSNLSSQGLRWFYLSGQKFIGKDLLGFDISFNMHEEIVTYIILDNNSDPWGNVYEKTWSNLSPETLIPKLGVPSRVQIRGYCGTSEGSLPTDCNYSMYIFYENKGVYFNYELSTKLGRSYPICPTFVAAGNMDNSFKIILKSSNDKTPIENYDQDYSGGTLFEDATGKALNDFYQAYLQPQKPPCFHLLPSFFK
jgi:hypothetical protein